MFYFYIWEYKNFDSNIDFINLYWFYVKPMVINIVMSNFNYLPLPDQAKDVLYSNIVTSRNFGNLCVEIDGYSDNTLFTSVGQKQVINQQIFTEYELKENVKRLFEGIIPQDMKLEIRVSV